MGGGLILNPDEAHLAVSALIEQGRRDPYMKRLADRLLARRIASMNASPVTDAMVEAGAWHLAERIEGECWDLLSVEEIETYRANVDAVLRAALGALLDRTEQEKPA